MPSFCSGTLGENLRSNLKQVHIYRCDFLIWWLQFYEYQMLFPVLLFLYSSNSYILSLFSLRLQRDWCCPKLKADKLYVLASCEGAVRSALTSPNEKAKVFFKHLPI